MTDAAGNKLVVYDRYGRSYLDPGALRELLGEDKAQEILVLLERRLASSRL